MPTYDYQCRSCGHITEVIHSMLEEGPSACERCGGELRRILHPAGIIFKGSGFFKTDSRSTGSASADSGSSAKRTAPVDGASPAPGGGDAAATGGDAGAPTSTGGEGGAEAGPGGS